MKIGKLLKTLPTILKMAGMGKVDIKKELNSLPNDFIKIIDEKQKEIKENLTTAILLIKTPLNELVLIPIGFKAEGEEAIIKQQLKPLNLSQVIKAADLEKLGELMDDENNKASFIEKLEKAGE